ncbi:MAG TPA: NAD(P)H-binding protein [Candidatus Dormibacteraeota bacterium]|nr:NAD(P)H-binding protein [Candidatus Dormibacteraeota bacterium]
MTLRIALFGATGFIGSAVLDEALGRGHEVRALVRGAGRIPPREGLTVCEGDAADGRAIAQTVAGAGAVVSALGTPRQQPPSADFLADAMRQILKAMDANGVRRLVAVSGAGITVPGERKPFPHGLISSAVAILARGAVVAKQHEFEVISASPLDWTVVRPSRVTDGPAVAEPRVGDVASAVGMRVSRRTLARFMVDLAANSEHVRSAPYISD